MATINSMVTILSSKSIPKIINSKFGAKVSDRTVNFFSSNVISYQRLKLAKLVSADNLSQIEPDINEDPIGQFEVNNIDMEYFKKVAIVNLDPANDSLSYECAVNIEELIKLEDVMVADSLGPNGDLLYCMENLEKNIDWLESKLKPLVKGDTGLKEAPKRRVKLAQPQSSFAKRYIRPFASDSIGKLPDKALEEMTEKEEKPPLIETMKLAELKEVAKNRGIKGYSKLKKSCLNHPDFQFYNDMA